MMAFVLALHHIHVIYSPSVQNSERLLARGKPKEAKAQLDKVQRATRQRPDSKTLLLRGKVLYAVLLEQMRAERWGSFGVNPNNWLSNPLAAEAEQCFLDAIALSPNDPEIRQVLGNLYREQGRFSDAEAALRSSLELDDSNADAFLGLGLLYAEGGRPDAARRALYAAWELDSGNPKIAKNIAYFHRYYANAPESSIVWFSRYFDCGPKRDPDVNLIRGELNDLLERYPDFEAYRRETASQTSANRGANRTFVPRYQSGNKKN